MIIERILLLNFKKYAQETVVLGKGIIGIFGPNGAGKSTIFDAICWCLYGVTPSMGREGSSVRQEELVRDGQEDMGVEMHFEHGGQHYVISRSYSPARGVTARVRTGGREVAASSREVSLFVSSILGLDAKAFVAASFIRQKEIDLLTSQRPGKRKDVINRLFGLQLYDQLRADAAALQQESAQEVVRLLARLSALGDERDSLTASLLEYGDSASEVSSARKQVSEAEKALKTADGLVSQHAQSYEQFLVLERQLAAANEQYRLCERSKEDIADSLAELSDIETQMDESAARAAALESSVSNLDALTADKRTWDDTTYRLEWAQETLGNAERGNREAGRKARIALEGAVAALDAARAEHLAAENAERCAAEAIEGAGNPEEDLSSARQREMKIRDRLEAERVKLGALEARRRELLSQQETLRQLGDAAECPLCRQRIPEHHFARVEEALISALRPVDTSISAKQSRIRHLTSLLEEARDDIRDAEARIRTLGRAQETHRMAVDRLQRAAQALKAAEANHIDAGKTVSGLDREIAAEEASLKDKIRGLEQALASVSFDEEQYQVVLKAANELSAERARLDELSRRVSRKAALMKKMESVESQLRTAADDISGLKLEVDGVPADKGLLDEARASSRRALERLSSSRETLSKLLEKERSARSVSGRLCACEDSIREASGQLDAVRETIHDFEVLKAAFKDIPVNVHERLKPAVQDEVSSLLDGLTHGKYAAVRISDDYTVEVLYNGIFYPIYRFSGGEKDLINLCLRIGISHVLVSLSKTQGIVHMDSLFLDDTFSSLDSERRQMLMGALMSLKSFFSQIVIITHVEDIKESLPRAYQISEDSFGVAEVDPL